MQQGIKGTAMKHVIPTLVIPLMIAASPGAAIAGEATTCKAAFDRVSAAWAEEKARLREAGEVTVATQDGTEEVPATDPEPTENWFGKPPEIDTVDGYLAEAKRAMQAGDIEACLAQVRNARAAFRPE